MSHTIFNVIAYACVLSDRFSLQEDMFQVLFLILAWWCILRLPMAVPNQRDNPRPSIPKFSAVQVDPVCQWRERKRTFRRFQLRLRLWFCICRRRLAAHSSKSLNSCLARCRCECARRTLWSFREADIHWHRPCRRHQDHLEVASSIRWWLPNIGFRKGLAFKWDIQLRKIQ